MKNEMNILVSDIPREGILRLTMDDQKSSNTLSEEMMSILIKAIEKGIN
jgi:enoyl-CoA hydratase/carnithine racemase